MISFKTTLKKFAEQGEKTGWTFIDVPAEIAQQIKPDTKKSYRVKGKLDAVEVSGLALVPMGGGDFIIALNATLRKALKKQKGDSLIAQLEEDKKGYVLNEEFIACLEDEPKAFVFFKTLPQSHQTYFSKWIDSAKTMETKSTRIALSINALVRGMHYGEMIRERTQANKNKL